MKKMNILKIFIIFITFFNCLFFSMEDAFSVTQKTVVGPRDRVRKFNELNFTYTAPMKDNSNLAESGFSCKPGGLKYMAFNKSGLGEAFDKGVGASYYAVINLLFFPLLCYGMLSIIKSIIGGSGFKIFFILIASFFGYKSLEYLESLIFDEDDFNLDMYNPYCLGVSLSMMFICIAILIIAKTNIKKKKKILIIISLNVAANGIKEIFKAVQYKIASNVFNNFELCGDNWLTYGSEILEYKLDGENIQESSAESNWNRWRSHISEAYPSRGAFNGSYKHKLNKCFIDGDINYCRIIYSNPALTSESISSLSSLLYKPYREFYYDGVEFSYVGCVDPRPDRKSYLGVDNQTGQLYYFRGNDSANFACDRFLVSSSDEYREAYKCCLEVSQKLICINNTIGKNYVMCNKDSDDGCEIKVESDVDLTKFEEDMKNSLNSDFCTNLKEQIKEEICENVDYNLCWDKNKNSEEVKSYDEICDNNGEPKLDLVTSGVSSLKNNDSKLDLDHVIKFKIRKSETDVSGNKYCVETYNLCPYNFRILGGTEQYGNEFYMSNDSGFEVEESKGVYNQKDANESDRNFNEKNNCTFDKEGGRHCTGPCFIDGKAYACYNKPSNFCQIDRHCVFIQPLVEKENESFSPYIDKACFDGIGSSHNFLNYEQPLNKSSKKDNRILVAPLVECLVETFKNILTNKAGHTICQNLNDDIVEDVCLNSNTVIKSGDDLSKSGYESPFVRIKTYLLNIVKAILVLSVMLYGYNIILFRKGATPEEILKYLLTLSLVVYFSFSNNWIDVLFSSVYNVYNKVSEFAVNLLAEDREKYNYDNPKYGGCFFFNGLYIDNKYDSYKNRKYVAVFDTFDCKLSRYFGYYANNMGNPPIVSIFIMGIFTAGLSILTMLPFILLFVSLMFFVVRIGYIFIVNSLTVTILLFMTPIFAPLILFERTKGFFQTWLKKIIQNVMFPLFIFMALSLFFVIFDKYYTDDAVFYGENEPVRSVYCNTICKISESNYFHLNPENSEERESCSESRGEVVDLKKNAPICAAQDHGVSNKTGVGLLDFIIEDFPGLPGLGGYSGVIDQMSVFFNMFFDLIFLLILVFIFEQFISYVNAMTGVIFSPDESGMVPGRGIDDEASGLPSLQKVTNITAGIGVKMANSSKDTLRYGTNKAFNKIKISISKRSGNKNNDNEEKDNEEQDNK